MQSICACCDCPLRLYVKLYFLPAGIFALITFSQIFMPTLMLLIGATPPGRNSEQHDVFFIIGDGIKDLVLM
jgi:hypothetical protein